MVRVVRKILFAYKNVLIKLNHTNKKVDVSLWYVKYCEVGGGRLTGPIIKKPKEENVAPLWVLASILSKFKSRTQTDQTQKSYPVDHTGCFVLYGDQTRDTYRSSPSHSHCDNRVVITTKTFILLTRVIGV